MPIFKIFRRGALVGEVVITAAEGVIGRDQESAVLLEDNRVSRHHARVYPGDGE